MVFHAARWAYVCIMMDMNARNIVVNFVVLKQIGNKGVTVKHPDPLLNMAVLYILQLRITHIFSTYRHVTAKNGKRNMIEELLLSALINVRSKTLN